MKILLITPQPSGGFSPPFTVLPLGIACIAAVGRQAGAEVDVFWGADTEAEVDDYLNSCKPDIAGMQTFINNMSSCFSIAERIKGKYPGAITVMGGVQASNFPEEVLQSKMIDCVITGEGEWTFQELLKNGAGNFRKVPGVVWRDAGGKIIRNPGGTVFENLDDLPLIPYPLFYRQKESRPIPLVRGHILTHRGCPRHCSHCPLRFRAGVPIRAHSLARVMDTIRNLQSEFGLSFIEFYDENFTLHPDLVRGICGELKGMNLGWSCTARTGEMTEELAEKMAISGCHEIIFGLGSGVPRLQKLLNTNEDLQHASRIISAVTKLGVNTVAAFALGIPTETQREFRESVRFALGLNARQIRFEAASPLPGTILYDIAKTGGRFLVRSWDDYISPGQMIYLPAGWRLGEFKRALFFAKVSARIKRSFPKIFG
jgi:anaerobic magnesium-protoporphyrin IX monomethyl ester cyclase